ncbi:MAG: stage IV sporulation protein A [Clostridia bacterium]|nr:stage IV sporulation protein A [Clostridia bacterium]
MDNRSIYEDIRTRTQGDIYIGVVGPVRTGKSTFVKRFMDTLVIPHMGEDAKKGRAVDELPQSAAGRTIMTTEPKFIPEQAAKIRLDGNSECSVRLIDCVGYIVPSSLGYIEGDQPRMVKTPWFEEEVPFNMAAELGTHKVISEHSTIGLVVTTDGSISDIPRAEYAEAEERVVSELRELGKPFIVLMNAADPETDGVKTLSSELSEKYGVPVLPVNCLKLTEDDIRTVLGEVLFEFPVREITLDFPSWLMSLPAEHPLKGGILESVRKSAAGLDTMRSVPAFAEALKNAENIGEVSVASVGLGDGSASVRVKTGEGLFYGVLSEYAGVKVENERGLMDTLRSLAEDAGKYAHLKGALEQVEATGYGIVMPDVTELTLEEPEIMKQGGRYGVRLKAGAPSIHMLRADIKTEVAPVVGSESQSEELVKYLLKEFEEDPAKIWQSNIFGTSLNDLVNEGLRAKLNHMPEDARYKLRETLEKIINDGCNGLICFIL